METATISMKKEKGDTRVHQGDFKNGGEIRSDTTSGPFEAVKPKPVSQPESSSGDCGVTVMSGATTLELQVARQTVGEVRKFLKEAFNIGEASVAIVNGSKAGEDQALNVRDRLEFVKKAGSKG